ncbi:putative major facilitator superfamily mfs_1 [Diplodia seriata]|uniref:Putative major facilitator superfamily mfs_1 n=1 Tax=Diplodia seriata TaxID=420778 RepID=A0A0G2ENW1_9PEZI|nr:putative major facilitator superfamily mfs_1 [Diplodia seriata]
MAPPVLRKIATELGLPTIIHAPRDLHLIFLTRFLRMAGYGGIALVLALFFAALSVSDERIGLFMTLTLLGDVALSLFLTLVADSLGRRRVLLLGCAGMAVAGAVFGLASGYWVLLAAAVVGVISRCEVDGYAAAAAAPAAGAGRGEYSAVGSGDGGPGGRKDTAAEDAEDSERDVFLTPSRSSEEGAANDDDDDDTNERPLPPTPPQPAPPPKPKMGFAQLSTPTRWMLLKLCALFCVDSLASGMVPYSLINFYLDRKFGLPKSTLGAIVAATWVTSSVGNVFAAAIAKRIGLVRTMVFTHLPSAVFLALIPAPNVVWLTAVLLVARGTLASMDQAPRSAFLSMVVRPEERTAVMGIVNVVKTLSQSGGPSVTGLLAGGNRFWIAFVVAGAMKAAYDCGLLTLFVKVEKKAEGAIQLDQRETRDLVDEFELDTDDEAFDSGDDTPGKRRDSAA